MSQGRGDFGESDRGLSESAPIMAALSAIGLAQGPAATLSYPLRHGAMRTWANRAPPFSAV